MHDAPYRPIPLHRRDGTVRAWTKVDPADYEWLNQWRWNLLDAGTTGYAMRIERVSDRRRFVLMHRELCALADGDPREVDHRNGNGRDNRRENIHVTSHALNQQNRSFGYGASSYRGVSWNREGRVWTAQVKLDGVQYKLGRFSDELDAAAAAAQWRYAHMSNTIEDPVLLARPALVRPRPRWVQLAAPIQSRWQTGESRGEIAAALGLSESQVKNLLVTLRKHGYDLARRT